MNSSEVKLVELLRLGKEKYGFIATKAEFEAEGSRLQEILRLLRISNAAGVEISIKIGGCEAISDLNTAKQLGPRYIVAPMIETPFALDKFIAAKNNLFSPDELRNTSFLFNVETITTYNNLDAILGIAASDKGCDGVVFGRVDFAGSLGLGRADIENEAISSRIQVVANHCREVGLDFVVGGAISHTSVPVLKQLLNVYLCRFETRKIIFTSESLRTGNCEEALNCAIEFELLWLREKQRQYDIISREDNARIAMLEQRLAKPL